MILNVGFYCIVCAFWSFLTGHLLLYWPTYAPVISGLSGSVVNANELGLIESSQIPGGYQAFLQHTS